MKIAVVTNTCWNVFNFREGLVKYFLDRGDEVISLAPKDDYTDEIVKWGVKHIETKLDQTGTNPIKDLGYLRRIISVFKSEKPDVSLSFTIKSNIYSSLAGKVTGIPTVCNVSGLGTVFLVEGWLGKLAINLYRFAFRYSSHIFFQNRNDKELFLSFISLKEDRIGLLPGSGIDLHRFIHHEQVISTPTKFLMVARVIEEKGVREFVEAAQLAKDEGLQAHFTLVGSLDQQHARAIPEHELRRWVEDGTINYLAHSSQIEQLLESHEVVVLPSYREGTPRTLLEGAATGRALLASDVPGCNEVVRDGFNGFLFKVKDGRSILDKVKLYLSLSDAEKRELAANSRILAEERFDENLVIAQYAETIVRIVDI